MLEQDEEIRGTTSTSSSSSSRQDDEGNNNGHVRTSMEVFLRHCKQLPDGGIDANGILSKACFKDWVKSRKSKLKNPGLTFVHTLRSHVTGDRKTGRNPFPPEVEKAILKLVRRKKVWPCFQDMNVRYGSRGMFVKGYHELRSGAKADDETKNGLSSPHGTEEAPRRMTRRKRSRPGTFTEEDSDDGGAVFEEDDDVVDNGGMENVEYESMLPRSAKLPRALGQDFRQESDGLEVIESPMRTRQEFNVRKDLSHNSSEFAENEGLDDLVDFLEHSTSEKRALKRRARLKYSKTAPVPK